MYTYRPLFSTSNISYANTMMAHTYKTLYRTAMDDQPPPWSKWEYNFIRQMKRLREARQMTQTDLARNLRPFGLKFHQQTIQRIETGERPVRLNEAHLIAKELGVDLHAMSETASPPARELLYAVDQLRRSSGSAADMIREAMFEWLENVGEFAVTLSDLIPPSGTASSDLEPVTEWGMAWAVKVVQAHTELVDAWESLQQIGGEVPKLHMEDTWEEMLPEADVIDAMQIWYDQFGNHEIDFAAVARPHDLYAKFPGDAADSQDEKPGED